MLKEIKAALAPFVSRFVEGVAGEDRRREPREFVEDATVAIGGLTYPVLDWSASGFRAGGYRGGHTPQEKVDVTFSVGLDEGPFEFRCQAILLRLDEPREEMAGAFVRMERAVMVRVARHFDSIVDGAR